MELYTPEYGEDKLVEQPAMMLLESLGWKTFNGYGEFNIGKSPLGRDHKGEVVLLNRLRLALQNLNPELPAEAIESVIEELFRDRSRLGFVEANREVHNLLRNGVKVSWQNPEDGSLITETARVIDWNDRSNNDFLAVNQFWVSGEMYTRRADIVCFVNGIPLLFFELKAMHQAVRSAFDDNLRDYKNTVPHLFWYNAFILLSNNRESRVGSVSAGFEHFSEWKKINDEGEQGAISLETTIRATATPERLLEITENFIVYKEIKGGTIKLVAKNHQFFGVNNAMKALTKIQENKGRLGIFWHTQGSGKSVSMMFFSQKVLRKVPGDWSFLVLTDRVELDNQIYKDFCISGIVTEKGVQARSSQHLRELLEGDHRYVFTLIHKFRTAPGEDHPVLSERDNIIVIADEAHRTQYDTLAMNMRQALPNAAFLAFTGTPLIIGEEKTREVFGEYVSIYNFKQSIDDKATVPLYYENRIPELQLSNEDLNDEIYQVIEEAVLDEEQEMKLERQIGRQYHLIARDDRLERIAKDIVRHFINRGDRESKAMVVCIDKVVAVKMYDKVQKYWRAEIARLRKSLQTASMESREGIEADIRYMEQTDMAVVVSQAQNEIKDMAAKGIEFEQHRKRMVKENLDEKFKDAGDPFRIVFVCAMWMTGFDVPSCSTIYIDKPMRNHSLMQTIARANRVFQEKNNGLIVDYVGIFRNLEKALAIYGSDPSGVIKPGENPVEEKRKLIEELHSAIDAVKDFLSTRNIDLVAIQQAKTEDFSKQKHLNDAVENILESEESKKKYLALSATVRKLFKAIKPDPVVYEVAPDCGAIEEIRREIRSLMPQADISEVMERIEEVLDRSISAEGYIIGEEKAEYIVGKTVDLSEIDFEALAKKFKFGQKRTVIEQLKNMIEIKLNELIEKNKTRIDYLEKFQKMIEEYNSGSANIEEFFDRLKWFIKNLSEEEKRHVQEGLVEEELAIMDLLLKPAIELTDKERNLVKAVSKELIVKLQDKLNLDWRKKQQSRAAVRLTVETVLDMLPRVFTKELYKQKCEAVYQHVYESYYGAGKSVYAVA